MLISHAQNFEDIILWRALQHVNQGFYIDVGAQDPQVDSVSLLFYERGWRGVHVEPTAEFSGKLRAARPDEEVIQSAISAREGTIGFFEIEGTGLGTGDPSVVERHQAKGWNVVETKVPTVRLGDLLDRYGDRDIHWLKIDVEGMEKEVIETWAPSLARPWIVVVESTEPTSDEPTYEAWQSQLEGLGYRFVYFDGLNRFYVSDRHPELQKAFGPGPNIFDDFALSGKGSAPFAAILKAEIAGIRDELGRHQEALAAASDAAARRETEYNEALASSAKDLAERDRLLADVHDTVSNQARASLQAALAWERVSLALTAELAEKSARVQELQHAAAELARLQSNAAAPRPSYLHWLVRGSSAWLLLKPGSRPRRVAGRLARAGVGYLRDKPRAKSAAIRLTALMPSLQARLFRLAAEQRAAMPELDFLAAREWYLEPEPAMQTKWATLLAEKPAATRAGR